MSTYESKRESDIACIEHEVRESNKLLDTFDSVLPIGCKKYMTGGNHEARYEKFKINKGGEIAIRRLKEFRSWAEEYHLRERGYTFCDYGEILKIGKILFTHGWYTSGDHASKHLDLYHKNIIYGHTHEFKVSSGIGVDGTNVISASIGNLANKNVHYLVGKPPKKWLHMFAYIDMRDDGTFTPHFIPIINGSFIAHGKEF